MEWIKRHKVWSGILAWVGLFLVGVVIDSATGTTDFSSYLGTLTGMFGAILFFAWAIWGRKKKG